MSQFVWGDLSGDTDWEDKSRWPGLTLDQVSPDWCWAVTSKVSADDVCFPPEHQREMGEGARRMRGRGAGGDSGKRQQIRRATRAEIWIHLLHIQTLICCLRYDREHWDPHRQDKDLHYEFLSLSVCSQRSCHPPRKRRSSSFTSVTLNTASWTSSCVASRCTTSWKWWTSFTFPGRWVVVFVFLSNGGFRPTLRKLH